jgi:drug/metabolite transporter (DMT)-like permease
MGYLYVIAMALLAAYGSLITKWRISVLGIAPSQFPDNIVHLLRLFWDPYIWSVCVTTLLCVLLWLAALSKLELSQAYPLVSLSFVLILIFSVLLFHEPLNLWKVGGVILIVAGIAVSVQG